MVKTQKNSEEAQKDLQKKYMQFQILKQQMTAMAEEKATLESRVVEIKMTADALGKMDSIKEGEEMWSTMGSGTFVRSKILDKKNVIVDIGLGICAKKDIEDAKRVVQERSDEMQKALDAVNSEMHNMEHMLQALEMEMQKLASEAE